MREHIVTGPHSVSTPVPFLLERWFAEFEFVEGMRNLAASGGVSPTVADVLRLAGDGALDRYLSLGLAYTESTGSPGLRGAVAGLYDTLGAGDVQITTGASEAILLLLWAPHRLVRDAREWTSRPAPGNTGLHHDVHQRSGRVSGGDRSAA